MSTPDKRESMSPRPCIHMRLICHFDHRAKKAEVDGKMVTEADSTNPNPVESRDTTASLSDKLFHADFGTRCVRQARAHLVQTH